jgi:hypothetical protein
MSGKSTHIELRIVAIDVIYRIHADRCRGTRIAFGVSGSGDGVPEVEGRRIMKKAIVAIIPFMFAACGGRSVNMELNSNDTIASSRIALSTPDGGTGPIDDLTTVKSVKVTVNEVDVFFDDDHGQATENADSVRDDDHGWQVVTKTPQTIDLMTIRGTSSLPLGTINASKVEIEQIRLKLKTDGDDGNGADVIRGAVTDANNQICDLIVPHSATNPGVKIEGEFRSNKLEPGENVAVVNIRLRDSNRLPPGSTCAFRLNPVIEIELVETKEQHDRNRP